MSNKEPLPLWMEAIPDREPWRRGRMAIALIAALVLLAQGVALLAALSAGNITAFFTWAISGPVTCLLLYLIWIGQNWARWIVAPIFGFFGVACLIWGMIPADSDQISAGKFFLTGLISITLFCYLALSPAVYAFARRQRENASLFESIVVAAGLLLVLASIGAALLAFHNYKNGLQEEATEFARLAFQRVFVNHDPAFLQSKASSSRKMTRAAEFINDAQDRLGRVQSVGPFGGTFAARFDGERIVLRGKLQTRAVFESGGYWVHVELSGYERHWAIEHISWDY